MPYSLALDILIVVLLVATIIYAARLSLYLKRFRDSKSDLENIITDLSRQIEKADKAIRNMHDAAEKGGNELQKRMDRANAMFDELQMVVEAGDALATRLEKLAVRSNSQVSETPKNTARGGAFAKKNDDYDKRLENIVRNVENTEPLKLNETPTPMFTIRDPDIERGEDSVDGFSLDDDNVDLLSDAERDLYQAIKTKKSRAGGKK